MADLKSKVEDALNETRILILGGQVIIGAAMRLYFVKSFEQLPTALRIELTVVLGLLLLAIGLLLFPAAYHQITERGEDTPAVHLRATTVMDATLIIFALGIGSYSAMAAMNFLGTGWASLIGIFGFVLSVLLWYVLPWSAKRHDKNEVHKKLHQQEREEREDKGGELTSLDEKIKTVLIECRMVLPGAQALLGFQLVTFVEPGFEPLPTPDKMLHIISLFCIANSTILLMAPAAFHRIAEGGENTPRMYRYTSTMLLWAMLFLALGICGDYAMVLHKVSHSYALAGATSGTLLLIFCGLWFGVSFYRRHVPDPEPA